LRAAPLALLLCSLLVAGCGSARAKPGSSHPVAGLHTLDGYQPPKLTITHPATGGVSPGLLFLAEKGGATRPGGPVIADNRGRILWYLQLEHPLEATDFRTQTYRGKPVLTWWQGTISKAGIGRGEYVVYDASYRQIATVKATKGLEGDLHEFQLTPRGTAYLSVYAPRSMDLTAVGGPRDGTIFESIVQEVDVASGRVVWEWHSADHLPVSEGVTPPKDGKPHDYFHVNSVDEDADGNLLISARNMHAIYAVRKQTGRVLWRLGGKRSDFRMAPGARFAFQHDATWLSDGPLTSDGMLSLFDNEATPRQADQSRGLVLRLDMRARTARVVRQYRHPDKLLAGAEGNVQMLPDGHVFVGWGPERHVSEFTRAGRLLFDLVVPPQADSYQAFRFAWHGDPLDRPALAARRSAGSSRRVTAWASWNGATALRGWQLLAGDDPNALVPLGDPVPRRDFETSLHARTDAKYVAVAALDARGRQIGRSRSVVPAAP
jgi:arylsulfotransferase ASST